MTRRFTIGRDKSCDIPIADDSVSRVHAEVWLAGDGSVMMADAGSSNGTHIIRNGQSYPLRQDTLLPTDQLRLGSIVLGVQDVIDAIESRSPGALRPPAQFAPAPPPQPPPPPAAIAGSLPRPGQFVRCHCGAIKPAGNPCPECSR
jgi:hypothetical protein